MGNGWNWKGWLAAAALLALSGGVVCAGAAQVENVRAEQRARSKTVDVWYDLPAENWGKYAVALRVEGDGEALPVESVSGDVGSGVTPGKNKRIAWDAGTDWPGRSASNLTATVTAEEEEGEDTGPTEGMVKIPAGTNSGNDPDYGEYSLTVEGFYMDKTEVTLSKWRTVYNWALEHGYTFNHGGKGKGARHPVHTVSPYDCMKWCNARSEMEGRTPAYWTSDGEVYRTEQHIPKVNLNGDGYRLPTNDEWEYAARGGLKGFRYPWGDNISSNNANYSSYYRQEGSEQPYTTPAGHFAPNGYGLYDMAGNVYEWTTDASGFPGFYRGGDWNGNANRCQCGDVHWLSPATANYYYGFRAVRRR